MHFLKNNLIIIFTLAVIVSCKKKDEDKPLITKDVISGFIQKGPFINGTSISLYELNESYSPTGKSYTSQIVDNSGFFQINNVSLVSQYVLLKADGFYFNEVTGYNSNSPITLYCLTDLSNKNSININILSHLEKNRIEFLIANGFSFMKAKKQAENEVLNIFSIYKSDIIDSEILNIAEEGDNNAILLAISFITQGYRTEAELSELLANISADIRKDGILNSSSLGSQLINDVRLFNLNKLRTNIEYRYASLGMTVNIPNFEKYIKLFLDSTTYEYNKKILYPMNVNFKQNILNDSILNFSNGNRYSIGADLPIGTNLKILVKPSTGCNMYGCGVWPMENIGWTYSHHYPDSMVFRATGKNQTVDMPFAFGINNSVDFIIYENNATTPTRIKTITTN